MHKIKFLPIILLVICAACQHKIQSNGQAFSIVVLGDMPYFLPKDYERFDSLIKEINKDTQDFNVFIGDFKSSITPCSGAAYEKIFGYFNQFKKPLIYTPGDNEWTDCHKAEAGSYVPEERLDSIRRLFFKGDLSFGQAKMIMLSQSVYPQYTKYSENKLFVHKQICFSTLHIVGSNNHYFPGQDSLNGEFDERKAANLFWLKTTFKLAKDANVLGIVLLIHADMFASGRDNSGFDDFKTELNKAAIDFKLPILLVNGDSHVYAVDQPFGSTVGTAKNVTRVTVFGETEMRAVRVQIEPNGQSLFSINPF